MGLGRGLNRNGMGGLSGSAHRRCCTRTDGAGGRWTDRITDGNGCGCTRPIKSESLR